MRFTNVFNQSKINYWNNLWKAKLKWITFWLAPNEFPCTTRSNGSRFCRSFVESTWRSAFFMYRNLGFPNCEDVLSQHLQMWIYLTVDQLNNWISLRLSRLGFLLQSASSFPSNRHVLSSCLQEQDSVRDNSWQGSTETDHVTEVQHQELPAGNYGRPIPS